MRPEDLDRGIYPRGEHFPVISNGMVGQDSMHAYGASVPPGISGLPIKGLTP
ncbi:MAG: hypothetical protein ACFFBV_16285 [Promethearchaeota archaeon]